MKNFHCPVFFLIPTHGLIFSAFMKFIYNLFKRDLAHAFFSIFLNHLIFFLQYALNIDTNITVRIDIRVDMY